MDVLFASIHGSYQRFEIALFKNDACLLRRIEKKFKASSHFLIFFQEILDAHNIHLSDFSFITLDHGPGAFTSLRVTITFVNALAYAQKIPLIGIDGLEALAQETAASLDQRIVAGKPTLLICLLNAYNNEVYYAIHEIKENALELKTDKKYKKIDALLTEIKKFKNYQLIFTGNGTLAHKELILQENPSALFPSPLIESCSAKQIAQMGREQWNKQENISSQLFPLYLKTQTFAIKK